MSKLRYGLPDRSTAHKTRASSIGSIKEPNLSMPSLSPTALAIACPRTIPVSSIVWWQSTIISPIALTSRLKNPCLAKLFNIWSKKPIPVSISVFPLPSISNVSLISVSLVFLSIVAVLSDINITP